ncbi:MAG: hypothetical protein HQL51_16130 [Magnetococcales bacterium]|nr:hypothetical protein [Magnetococcales bacterium]
MSVSAGDFLESARRLLSHSEEMDQRNVASRAYYAAFHASRQLMAQCVVSMEIPSELDPSARIKHARLMGWMSGIRPDAAKPDQDETRKAIQRLGPILRSAYQFRELADYQITQSFPPEQAAQTFEQCERLLARIEAIHTRLTPP